MNGDGLDDFYIGGARGRTGTLYIQQRDGRFKPRPLPSSEPFEDMGALLFDADGDGHLDLYIVSGGVEWGINSSNYRDRLYLNDGKGEFRHIENALPGIDASGSCVVACDFDGDGDLDLFVGGRISPRDYPSVPASYLLVNESQPGKPVFVDATDSLAPALRQAGMVTAALWTDFDNDGKIDLILAGEWMPLRFFRNTGSSLVEVTDGTGLTNTTGWWNSIAGADFDQDGDIDYLLGNLGLNSELKASPEKPVSLYAKDFDNDGNIDPILFRYIHEEKVPVHSRDMLVTQLPSWQSRFPSYSDYAKIHLANLFTEAELEGAIVYRAGEFRNAYLENLGNGRFRLHPLPNIAQTAPVFGMVCGDFDLDGFPDALLVGNSYASAVAFGRYDAWIGMLLQGMGDGRFNALIGTKTGFFVDSDAVSLVQLHTADRQMLLLSASNNDHIRVHRLRSGDMYTLPLLPEEAAGRIYYRDGRIERTEYPYGSGYLSGNSRRAVLHQGIAYIDLFDFRNRPTRTLEISSTAFSER